MTGFVDTGDKFMTGVVDTCGKFATGVVDTGHKSDVGHEFKSWGGNGAIPVLILTSTQADHSFPSAQAKTLKKSCYQTDIK